MQREYSTKAWTFQAPGKRSSSHRLRSSGEWIQRRGRILRRHPGKAHAVLHDFLALPPVQLVRSAGDSDKDLKRIVRSELSRAFAFAAHARNGAGSDGVLAHLELIKSAYWPRPEHRALSILQAPGDHLIGPVHTRGDTMVSNYDRIYLEIQKEAKRVEREPWRASRTA